MHKTGFRRRLHDENTSDREFFLISFNLSVTDYVKGLVFKTFLKSMKSFHTFACMYLIYCNIITPWHPDSSLSLDFRNYISHVFFICPGVVIFPSDEE